MVWFQCEDCGENLKKPKLENHFRQCSARKLSCIDCGVVFSQQSVRSHTQCISEAEKYGPKGDVFIHNGSTMGANIVEGTVNGVDLYVGLSTSAPWNCRLCNVNATSQESLAIHAQGKRHKSKARAASTRLVGSASDGLPRESEIQLIDANLKPNGAIHRSESPRDRVKDCSVDEGNGHVNFILEFKDPNQEQTENREKNHGKEETMHVTGDSVVNEISSVPQALCFQVAHSTSRKGLGEKHRTVKKRKWCKSKFSEGVVEDGVALNVDACCNSTRKEQGLSEKFAVDRQPITCKVEDAKKPKLDHGIMNGICDMHGKWTSQNQFQCSSGNRLLSSCPIPENLEVGQMLHNGEKGKSCDHSVVMKVLCESHHLATAVKWKKIIKKALKKSPDGSLRRKELQAAVFPLALQAVDSIGFWADKATLRQELDRQISLSSKFIIDGKVIRLKKVEKTE